MKSTKKAMILACALLALCIAMTAGTSFALFTDTVNFSNHIVSGDLELHLIRTDLTTNYLNNKGRIDSKVDHADQVFGDEEGENFFGLDRTDDQNNLFALVAPGCSVVAEAKIDNPGNVAFGYYLVFKLTDNKESDAILARQLMVTVKDAEGNVMAQQYLDQGLTVTGADNTFIAEVNAGEQSTVFTVIVEFVDEMHDSAIENDDAQNMEIWFDMQVHAVQLMQDSANQKVPGTTTTP